MPTPPVDSSRHYPVACPRCTELKGFPVLVRTVTHQSGNIEVKLKCRDCNHEWADVIRASD